MKRKKYPNRKKIALVKAATNPKNVKIDHSHGKLAMLTVIALFGLYIGFISLYITFQKIPVYQKGKVVNMPIIEKGEPHRSGRHGKRCNIKLYYDGYTFSETVDYSREDAIFSNVPRKYLKDNLNILKPNENLFLDFMVDIVFIFLFGGSSFYIIRRWYEKCIS